MPKASFAKSFIIRLNVVLIMAPPLKPRGDDIPEIAHHFISNTYGEELSWNSIDWLKTFNRPGNVRELENLIR